MNKHDRVVSPIRTLLSLLAIGAGCGLLMWVIPDEGLRVNDRFTLSFAGFADFEVEETVGISDAEQFLENYLPLLSDENKEFEEDSLRAIDRSVHPDSLKKGQYTTDMGPIEGDPSLEQFRERLRIQSGQQGIANFDRFFSRARSAHADGSRIRVLHYGDSQIEADRISRYLRNELQKRYGGVGPGLIPPVEIVPTGAIKQQASANWRRHTLYGKPDTTIKHARYAPLCSFASYDSSEAELVFGPSKMAYGRAARYEIVKMLYANYASEAMLEVYADDSLYSTHLLPPDSTQHTLLWELTPENGELRFRFIGESIECYAMSFEGYSGVQVDNVPMRGSSGTIFRKLDRPQFTERMHELDPALVILQYGGNSVPYVKDSTAAENYGRWMRSQINLIKTLSPETAIIFIGPSDMAYKEKDRYVTYPMLEKVRDELKAAAIETGCGYWDLYEVMGGRNSMAAWVASDPPLAGTDYVHFTPKGARKVAELLVQALIDAEKEYNDAH